MRHGEPVPTTPPAAARRHLLKTHGLNRKVVCLNLVGQKAKSELIYSSMRRDGVEPWCLHASIQVSKAHRSLRRTKCLHGSEYRDDICFCSARSGPPRAGSRSWPRVSASQHPSKSITGLVGTQASCVLKGILSVLTLARPGSPGGESKEPRPTIWQPAQSVWHLRRGDTLPRGTARRWLSTPPVLEVRMQGHQVGGGERGPIAGKWRGL